MPSGQRFRGSCKTLDNHTMTRTVSKRMKNRPAQMPVAPVENHSSDMYKVLRTGPGYSEHLIRVYHHYYH